MDDETRLPRKCGNCGYTSPSPWLYGAQADGASSYGRRWQCDACATWLDERGIALLVDPILESETDAAYVEPWRPDAWAYFAAHALPGVIQACAGDTLRDGLTRLEMFAERAGLIADAMMAEYAKVVK